MKYFKKRGDVYQSAWKFVYEKPSICPYCGTGTDALLINKDTWSFGEGKTIFVATGQCTACSKVFLFAAEEEGGTAKFATMYPQSEYRYQSDIIQSVSERFIDLYNQALDAENRGAIDLASFGYRASLEVLVKDYAIKELKKPDDEVAQKSLFQAIGDYLEDDSLIKSADVIRILGNDYAHYERKYPEHDFAILKKYMEIFIHLVETKLMLAHPPVHR